MSINIKSSTKFFNNPSIILSQITNNLSQRYNKRALLTPISFKPIVINEYNYNEQLCFLGRLMVQYNHSADFNCIEKNLTQIFDFGYKKCILYNFLYIYLYLIGLPLNLIYLNEFHQNLQSIVSIINEKTTSDQFSHMFAQGGIDTYATVELLYLSIALYLRLFFPEISLSLTNTHAINSQQIEKDVCNLVLIYHMSTYLTEIIDAIKKINDLLRCKSFLSIEIDIDKRMIPIIKGKCIIYHYEIFTYIMFLIKKYTIYPSLNALKIELHLIELGSLAKNLFNIFEENMIHYYKNHEQSFQKKLFTNNSTTTTIDNLLLFGILNIEHHIELKFTQENYYVDYCHCFPFHCEIYASFLMSKMAMLLNNQLTLLMNSIKDSNNDKFLKITLPQIDIVILKNYVESLKNLFINYLTFSYESDNVYDITTKNQWLKNYFDVYAISDVLFIIMEKVIQYNSTINSIIPMSLNELLSNCVQHLAEGLLCKEKLLFPIKLYHYKQIIIKNSLIIFDYILSTIDYCLNELLNHLRHLPWFISLIDLLGDMSRNQMMLVFLFSNRILQKITIGHDDNNDDTYNTYHQRLRIYGYPHNFPFNYNDIIALNHKEHKSILNSSSSNKINTSNSKHLRHIFYPSSITKEDKENNHVYANECTNRATITIENPETDYKYKKRNENKDYKTSFDITAIKNQFCYEHLKGIFGNGVGYLEKEGRAFLMFTTTEPIILIQMINGIEKGLYLQENTVLSHMEIELNAREMILEHIYGQKFNEDNTANEMENYDKTVKNYDNDNKMKFFAFVDQLKILLS